MRKAIDITGRRFGSLVALKRVESHIKENGQKVTMWECLCDCGEKTTVSYGNLRSGNVKSCGNRKNHRPKRVYEDLTGKKFGKLTVIDRAADYINKDGHHLRKWRCKCDCGNVIEVLENNLKKRKSCGCDRYPDLTGQRFGRLTVIKKSGRNVYANNSTNTVWKCRCDCGNVSFATTNNLKRGNVKSCGCWKIDSQTTHGMSGTRIYRIWNDMRTRCYSESHKSYPEYGGRGITVCDEWKNSSDSFIEWALENGYNDSLTLDRIDNNKGYSPNNCRWATMKEQANNTRKNVVIKYNGEEKTISQWADELGINRNTLSNRIKRGWSVERAFETR